MIQQIKDVQLAQSQGMGLGSLFFVMEYSS